MEETLIFIIQGFFQFLFQCLSNIDLSGLFDSKSTSASGSTTPMSFEPTVEWAVVTSFVLGLLFGLGSLAPCRNALLETAPERLCLFFAAPVFSGMMGWSVGQFLNQVCSTLQPRHLAYCTLWLCVGLDLVRFGYCVRP